MAGELQSTSKFAEFVTPVRAMSGGAHAAPALAYIQRWISRLQALDPACQERRELRIPDPRTNLGDFIEIDVEQQAACTQQGHHACNERAFHCVVHIELCYFV